MSRLSYIIFLGLLAMLLAVSSCVEPSHSKDLGEEDLYTVHFQVRTQDDAVLTKAGSPIPGVDNEVDELYMYCFDENGLYLGRFPATIGTPEPLPYDNSDKYGTYEGQIPPATSRVHFVANANCPVGNDMIGHTEKEIMNAPGLVCSSAGSSSSDGSRMAYWGYLRRENAQQLKAVISTGQSIVYMVRDRACIQAGTVASNLTDVSWVVYNGLKHGYIASFGKTKADGQTHTSDWYDSDNPYQELSYTLDGDSFSLSTELTPYPDEDPIANGRFTTSLSDMVPFNSDNSMFVFDDECPPTDAKRVVKLIVKATFTTGTRSTRYFPICITNGYDSEPIPIKRGHIYKLDLQAMPEAAGYLDDPVGTPNGKTGFQKAAEALSFVNGSIVDIPGEVIEVSDGRFDMKVTHLLVYPLSRETVNSTAILVQNPNTTSVTVDFTIDKRSGNKEKFYLLESSWLNSGNAHNSSETSTITWGNGITSNGTDPKTSKSGPVSTDTVGSHEDNEELATSVTFPILSAGTNLKQSVYNLKGYYWGQISGQDVKHILMRNIYIYSITEFQIDGTPTLEKLGNTNNYRLKFKLPSGNNAYPELLYPLQVKMASKTLEPYAISIGDGTAAGQIAQDNPVFGVQVRSTVGAPSNITAQSTAVQQWDYQEANNYWDFWYTYSVTSIPRTSGGGAIIQGPEIWIDLKDIRDAGGFSTATRPNNVGLYLYIEFFGSAIPVTVSG